MKKMNQLEEKYCGMVGIVDKSKIPFYEIIDRNLDNRTLEIGILELESKYQEKGEDSSNKYVLALNLINMEYQVLFYNEYEDYIYKRHYYTNLAFAMKEYEKLQ